ncbi:uncharacterized protein LOC9323962 [Arabidopsis lyrata subsp. lyrata]|uniref:uncharacterized protein LOC9323962 n=1 Tax=Arabidopsis lyrata subsp. lyrata TaxID=81972 RepID=UPI000A29BBA5|nr:uncharacterized protein LOC9323962 [Arabidopsis lyrata subsp. lyrata]|eukprot:XP_020891053.1 uncharacterized protein LOC9323962 [Arabidopsis lyrata subsp. lyrata]
MLTMGNRYVYIRMSCVTDTYFSVWVQTRVDPNLQEDFSCFGSLQLRYFEPLSFPIGAANDKTRCYVYMKGSKDNPWSLNCSVILQRIANGKDSSRITKVLCRCSHGSNDCTYEQFVEGLKISSTGTGQYLYVCAAASSADDPRRDLLVQLPKTLEEFLNS